MDILGSRKIHPGNGSITPNNKVNISINNAHCAVLQVQIRWTISLKVFPFLSAMPWIQYPVSHKRKFYFYEEWKWTMFLWY
jgi:hypothetical protein